MGSTNTGQMFTQAEYEALTEAVQKNLVELSPQDQAIVAGMNRKDRRKWFRAKAKKEAKLAKAAQS